MIFFTDPFHFKNWFFKRSNFVFTWIGNTSYNNHRTLLYFLLRIQEYEVNFRIEVVEEGKVSPAVFSHSLGRFTVLPWGMNQNEMSTGENINLKSGRQNENWSNWNSSWDIIAQLVLRHLWHGWVIDHVVWWDSLHDVNIYYAKFGETSQKRQKNTSSGL